MWDGYCLSLPFFILSHQIQHIEELFVMALVVLLLYLVPRKASASFTLRFILLRML